jgi:acetyl-CoA synthetase
MRGQVAKAFVVTDRALSDAYIDELKIFTRERLSQHEFPRHIAFVTELPKTPAGKVHRKILRDREQEAAGDQKIQENANAA